MSEELNANAGVETLTDGENIFERLQQKDEQPVVPDELNLLPLRDAARRAWAGGVALMMTLALVATAGVFLLMGGVQLLKELRLPAWLAYGLAQLRTGQVEKGMESLKGGITLASKVMVDGYHNYLYWDTRGLIRASIRRSAFLLTKGAEEKDSIIQVNDRLLAQIDDEENFQRNTYRQNTRPLYGNN